LIGDPPGQRMRVDDLMGWNLRCVENAQKHRTVDFAVFDLACTVEMAQDIVRKFFEQNVFAEGVITPRHRALHLSTYHWPE
jgi:hypothetical protein